MDEREKVEQLKAIAEAVEDGLRAIAFAILILAFFLILAGLIF